MSRFTHVGIVRSVIDIPGAPAEAQERDNGAAGRAFIAGLPDLAADFLHRRRLTLDGQRRRYGSWTTTPTPAPCSWSAGASPGCRPTAPTPARPSWSSPGCRPA
ncbi:hypothetical protein ACIP4Y_19875 [Streptomyces sp. NPDC088810]|uniref:hypothetical protein n=1 Tax=Streptomyces sp. NPDC088810 TaxID=3365904 RepID=UPI0037F682DB